MPGTVGGPADASVSLEKPRHVFSTKCVSDHTKPLSHTAAPSTFQTPTQLGISAHTHTLVSDPGEGVVVLEHKGYGEDLTSGLVKLRKQVEDALVQPDTRDKAL